MTIQSQLAPGVPGWTALGVADESELLEGRGSWDVPGAWELGEYPPHVTWRVPLPGTAVRVEPSDRWDSSSAGSTPSMRRARPLGAGTAEAQRPTRSRKRPAGAGTGWIDVQHFAPAGLGRALYARMSAPRSSSLALRQWNLLCQLRADGIVTPEPLAWCARGGQFFAQESVLVTRSLEGTLPVLEWMEAQSDPEPRRIGATALGLFLARLFASRVELGDLSLADLHISTAQSQSRPDARPGDCAAEQILSAQSDLTEAPFAQDLTWRRLPDVALVRLGGARMTGPCLPTARRRLLGALDLEAAAWPRALRLRVGVLGLR